MVLLNFNFPQLSYTPLHLATWTINKAAINTVSELLHFDVDVNMKDKVSFAYITIYTVTHNSQSFIETFSGGS